MEHFVRYTSRPTGMLIEIMDPRWCLIVAVFIDKNINIHHLSKTLSFIMIRTTNAIDSRHEKAHGNWLILDKIESIPVLFRAPSFFLEWLSTDSICWLANKKTTSLPVVYAKSALTQASLYPPGITAAQPVQQEHERQEFSRSNESIRERAGRVLMVMDILTGYQIYWTYFRFASCTGSGTLQARPERVGGWTGAWLYA